MGESLTALFLQNPELANAIRRRQEGAAIMQGGMDSSPIRSPWQGLSRLAQALVGGYEQGQADKDIKAYGEKSAAETGDFLKRVMGGGMPPTQPANAPPTAPVAPVSQAPLAPPDMAPLIQAEAEKRGIPPSLATALFATESNFNPTARNPRSGAFGLGQVLASTMANPGYGMQPTTEAELSDPRKAVPWSLDYLKARGGALGVTDWNDPQQQARALRAYGENTDEYVNKVQSRMGAPLPQGAGPGAPAPSPAAGGLPGGMDPRAMQALALEAANSRNPRIQAMAPLLMQMAKSEDQTANLAPGGQLIDKRTGGVIATNNTVSPTTQVNLDQRGPSTYDSERGKDLAASVKGWEEAGAKSTQTLSRLTRMEAMLDNFTTGAGSQTSITAGQLAQRMGIPAATLEALNIKPETVATGEAIRSLSSQMLVGMLGAGGFPTQGFSNADRDMLERALPSLQNSPQGNRLIIQIMRAAANRDLEIGQAWRAWSRTKGDSLASVRDFQAERLPQITERDIVAPMLEQGGWQEANPTAQGAQPAQPQPGGVSEGATATNPQTGEKLIFRNGQWGPAR